jgi:hypothetical protein
MPSVLLVDPDRAWLRTVRTSLPPGIDVDLCSDFPAAREHVLHGSPTFLITNLRLDAYNGLHLVLLTTAANSNTRCLVYGEGDEDWAAREVRRCGAFFERRDQLLRTVNDFVNGRLPTRERRGVFAEDRRGEFRGGRRSTDLGTHEKSRD